MKKNIYIIGIALLTAWTLPVFSQVSNDNEDRVNKIDVRWAKNDFVPGQVLVKFKDANRVTVRRSQGQFSSTSIDKVTAVLQKYGTDEMEQLLPNENPNRKMRRARAFNGEMIQERDLSQLYCLKLSAEHQHETLLMVEELNALDEVEYAEPNYRCYIMGEECIAESFGENPMARQQWYLDAYGVTELWDKPIINSERPIIAIIDTGVDTEHPDLKDNCIEGYDFVNNTPHVVDDNMHGTHVAGIAAACNNETGIVGANPRALIMPVKVMDKNGRGNTATILQGVQYAVDHGAKILNLSLGGYGYSKAAADVYRNASLSAIIVAAAGNDGKCIYASHAGLIKHGITPAPSFPGAYSFVLGVQATNRNGDLAPFTNYDDDGPLYSCEASLEEPDGFNYEIKAPGTEIISTVPGGSYAQLQGTSMASPLVAGAISALMMVKKYDSQERLWAELLHTNNIAEAYALTELPADLDVVRIMLRERKEFSDETEEAYISKNEVNAGETINIYPVIRCTAGEASNIKIKLEVDEYEDPNCVQIITDDVDFGWHLDAMGKAVSKNPLVVKIPEDIADSRHIRMKVTVLCENQEGTNSRSFTFLTNSMETIGGQISEDKTLYAGHAYYVNEDLLVQKDVTLTIEPGTRLEFAEDKGLVSYGKLVAKGTKEKPIVFTSHSVIEQWRGLMIDPPTIKYCTDFYMNSDTTLFTLCQTDLTPIKAYISKTVYYNEDEGAPNRSFKLNDYLGWGSDSHFVDGEDLTDVNYITQDVLNLLDDWREYSSKYPSNPEGNKNRRGTVSITSPSWKYYIEPTDTITYCKFENCEMGLGSGGATVVGQFTYPYMQDCIVEGKGLIGIRGIRNNGGGGIYSNLINVPGVTQYGDLKSVNFFNNVSDEGISLYIMSAEPKVYKSNYPSYLGTSREELIRPYVYELGATMKTSFTDTWGAIDLSNMRKEPIREAHGIVWKVCVNGKDAQDEYEDLAPLGVGKHKFEVYFNRPMNKEVIPSVSFGVRDPWTQNAVNEDGSWNDEGTLYTVYKTITGKTKSDGVNRIYVLGAEDNEYFLCPYEKSRFNINVQAAGSMATGFAAEASLGRVNLTWDNSQNDMEDAMGYNVYRFNDEKKKTIPGHYENGKWVEPVEVPDTVRINEKILDVETSVYTDYDVIPNHTYYYLYKVLSTDLKEYDVSNIVAATPKTSILGDANGSGEVDVADVVTTVNYAIGMTPDPFIFDAADMNEDKNIDVLDVIGIVQKVLYPNGVSAVLAAADLQATYTMEDGILYVESPVAMAGVQVQVTLDGKVQKEEVRTADDLKGFEQASSWLTDEDYLLLAYSMNGKTLEPGKHALLYVGDSDITQLRLSDAYGRQIKAIAGQGTTNVTTMGSRIKRQEGIYDLQGRKLSTFNSQFSTLKKGVYIINGQKVVK